MEILGGGSRIPRVQAMLQEALGGRPLDKHMDADESVRACVRVCVSVHARVSSQ